MGAEQSLEQADPSSASAFSRLLPKSGAGAASSGRPDGVVVVSGPSTSGVGGGHQTEFDKLAKIPLFSPFIKSSINLFGFDSNSIDGTSSALAAASPNAGLGGTQPMLDSRALAAISTRLQEHLRQCADAVAFDQNALCNRMSEIDLSIAAAHSCLAERHRRYTRFCEQLVQMKEMCSMAAKVKAGVEQTHRGLFELNSLLPPEMRLQIPELPASDGATEDGSRSVSASNSMEVPPKRLFETAASSASSSTSSHLHHSEEVSNQMLSSFSDIKEDDAPQNEEKDDSSSSNNNNNNNNPTTPTTTTENDHAVKNDTVASNNSTAQAASLSS